MGGGTAQFQRQSDFLSQRCLVYAEVLQRNARHVTVLQGQGCFLFCFLKVEIIKVKKITLANRYIYGFICRQMNHILL